jgi:hypothetical protein
MPAVKEADNRLGNEFARGAIEAGHPEAAAAAVVCFELLRRPEKVLAGYLVRPD